MSKSTFTMLLGTALLLLSVGGLSLVSAEGRPPDNAGLGALKARVAALEVQVARLEDCNDDMERQQAATIEKLLVTMSVVEDQAALIDQLCICSDSCCAPKRLDPSADPRGAPSNP